MSTFEQPLALYVGRKVGRKGLDPWLGIAGDDGEPAIELYRDGRVVFGAGITPTLAARIFWARVGVLLVEAERAREMAEDVGA